MFRRLIMAIFRFYMNHLTVVIQTYMYIWATYMGKGGGKLGTRFCIRQNGWDVGCMEGSCCYQAMSRPYYR